MQAFALLLLIAPCAAEVAADREEMEQSIKFQEAQIAALEHQLAKEESEDAKKAGVTLLISVNEDDAEQIPLRLPRLINAQNTEFSGGKWLVYDNNGAKPSLAMRQLMEKAMEDKHVDGFMEVDYGKDAISKLYNKVGMRFATTTPTGNLAHYYMMDQCETEYCAHFDLSVAAHAKDGYSWVDSAKEVLQHNTELVQVTSATPSNKVLQAGSLLQTDSGVKFKEVHTNRFITGRMFLMDKQRYESLFQEDTCKDSTMRWEESVSCKARGLNLKRASLNQGDKGWHLEFPAPAGKELADALNMVDRGVAVTSKLLPHRAAALELWGNVVSFESSM